MRKYPYGFQDLATVDSILLKELPPVDDADAVIIIFFFSFLCHSSIFLNFTKRIFNNLVCCEYFRGWLLKDWWI